MKRIALVVLFIAAALLRMGALAQYEATNPLAEQPVIDERSYVEWGARIAAGDWLGDEVFFQEPLYPYFIGLVFRVAGEDLGRVRLLQCLLGAMTTLLIWKIARDTFGTPAAWVAGVSFAVYPPAILLPCLLLKPNLFLPLLGCFVLLLLQLQQKRRTWLLLGVLGGLGALLRGNMLILLPLFALWPWWRARGQAQLRRQARLGTACFVAGAALVLLPVCFRNWVVGDQFALTTSGAGTNVYGGNNAHNPHGIATEFDWVRGIPRYEARDWRREAERRLGHELDASQSSSYWLGQVLESMGSDPGLHLSIFWNKLRLALNHYEVADNHFLEWDRKYVGILRWPWPGFGWLGGMALAGMLLALSRRKRSAQPLLLALVFILYLGTIVLTVMSMRARLPLVVMLFPFTGFWLVECCGLLLRRERPRREGLAIALSGLIGLSFAFWPVFDEGQRELDLAERDYNLAVQQLRAPADLESAARLARSLARDYPKSSRLQILLAETEWRRGLLLIERGDQAPGQRAVRVALLRLRPITDSAAGVNARERSRAFRLAAYIQAELGNWSAAQRFFAHAREFAGEDLELMVSHGQALLETSRGGGPQAPGQATQARELLQAVIASAPDSTEASGARALLLESP